VPRCPGGIRRTTPRPERQASAGEDSPDQGKLKIASGCNVLLITDESMPWAAGCLGSQRRFTTAITNPTMALIAAAAHRPSAIRNSHSESAPSWKLFW
jgi:hypothetical protein